MTPTQNPKDDKELLELAAKAAGLKLADEVDSYLPGSHALWIVGPGGRDLAWQPFGDDGDALRLAVKLGLDLMRTDDDIEAIAGLPPHASMERSVPAPFAIEPLNGDPYAATRRAIVRAAAEIARKESSHG